jgi:cyclophilin family peptidyl-prolyl cis-trans isomerase
MRSAPLALAALLFLAPAATADEPPPVHVPETRPVQLDGAVPSAEWSDAVELPTSAAGTTLRLQQYRGTLMLAFASDRTWSERATLSLFFCPEGPHAGGAGPGCVRMDYEPFEHNREHLLLSVYGPDGGVRRVHDRAVVRHTLGPGSTRLEMAFGLDLLGLTKARRPTVRFCAQWSRPGSPSVMLPAGLDFRSPPGKAPADFASAARWVRLTGWGDPSGPGAFSRTDWTAWIEEARQITIHGSRAHERVREIAEEWKKTEKKDAEIVPEVIGNLEWVREREPLTDTDLLAMATVLRYLNRHERAAGLLEALVDRGGPSAGLALHQRALLNRSREAFEDEARDWDDLARLNPGPYAQRYRAAAEQARARLPAWKKEQAARRADEADATLPRVRLQTARGPVEIVLHAHDVPKAVKHFVGLVSSGFYDGTLFHRVMGDFMAQGGDPKSRDLGCEQAGTGSSPEEIDVEVNPRHGFWRGAVAYARSGVKLSNGSQFFILTSPRPGLGRYTVFGHVASGMAAVDRLEQCDALVKAVVVGR